MWYDTFADGLTHEQARVQEQWEEMQRNPVDLDQISIETAFIHEAVREAKGWRKQTVPSFKLLAQLRNILKESEIHPEVFRLDIMNRWPNLDQPTPIDRGTRPPLTESTQALLQVRVQAPELMEADRIQRHLLSNPILSPLLERVDILRITPLEKEHGSPSTAFIVLYTLTFKDVVLKP